MRDDVIGIFERFIGNDEPAGVVVNIADFHIPQPRNLDIGFVYQIRCRNHGHTRRDRLEKGISEAFPDRQIGDKIRVCKHVAVCEKHSAFLVSSADRSYAIRNKMEPNVTLFGESAYFLDVVIVRLVALIKRDDIVQLSIDLRKPLLVSRHEFNRILETLTADDPGRLNDENIVVTETEFPAEPAVVIVKFYGIFEILAVRDNMRGDAFERLREYGPRMKK